MKALVTGASGFVGSRLVCRLLERGHDVVAFGRSFSAMPESTASLQTVSAEFRNFDSWGDILHGVTDVFHLGWSSLPTTASANPTADAHENVLGTLRLLDALRERPGVRFVFASSGGTVYGQVESLPIDEDHATRPMSAYGVSKLAVENYLRFFHLSHGLRPVTLRISNIYGPGQAYGRQFGAINTFAAGMIQGEEITLFGDGSTVRDYVHVNDVLDALLAAAACPHAIECCNIGSGEGRSLNQIIAAIRDVLQREPALRHLPARAYDVPISILDIGRAQARLNWRPMVTFEAGLRETVVALEGRIRG